ncbi:hypothetical protein [Cellulomonas citrea]|uniref:hypothetical protein n=1 Tax=Cellulomonas citrea TaxID=1909423 RepID=UPI00135771AE|nr:hypothetical protein [Cellulomonas citrea]
MRTQPGWWSQPFRPDGGIAAEGLRNQLGRPSLSVLTVLVREAAQNSWDARLPTGDLQLEIDLGDLDRTPAAAWRTMLGPGAPELPAEETRLRTLTDYLNQDSLTYLAISDRNATGLGGPVRSDEPAPPGGRGWLSFVLNSGERRDVEGGGGTYGFGKGAFFLASRVGVILIHTRFRDETGLRVRLIGSALLHQRDETEPPLTGRHWWGQVRTDHCTPLEDDQAEATARALGLPAFSGADTGTTVVVLDPELGTPGADEDRQMERAEAGRFLADAAALNLWPITLHGRTQRMAITVTVDGAPVDVPDETNNEVIRAFARAYRKSRGDGGSRVTCGNPKADLGYIAHEAVVHTESSGPAAAELGLPTDAAPHHAALLRSPDLVVRYLPGPPRPDPAFGYAAVFRADDSMDHVFSAAEPPTHDDWVPDQLDGWDRSFVRVARRRITEYCSDVAGIVRTARSHSTGSVGQLSRQLGFLMDAVTQDGGAVDPFPDRGGSPGGDDGSRPSGGGAATGRRSARIRATGEPEFRVHEGEVLLTQVVDVAEATLAQATVRVVTAEGAEQRSPAAAARPEVLGWVVPDGTFAPGARVELPEGSSTLLIRPVEDAAIEFTVSSV